MRKDVGTEGGGSQRCRDLPAKGGGLASPILVFVVGLFGGVGISESALASERAQSPPSSSSFRPSKMRQRTFGFVHQQRVFLSTSVVQRRANISLPSVSRWKAKPTESLRPASTLSDQPTVERERSQKFKAWRTLEQLTESYDVPTIVVPSAVCHSLLNSKFLQRHLATRMEELGAVRPRIRLVRDINAQQSLPHPAPSLDFDDDGNVLNRKLLLLNPTTVSASDDSESSHQNVPQAGASYHDTSHLYLDTLRNAFPGLPLSTLHTLAEMEAVPGPNVTVQVPYSMQTVNRILSKILPVEAHPPPVSFEQVGHVVHLNLKSRHEPFAYLIGDVILDRLPTVRTVVNKVGQVHGPHRTYDMEVLAGEDNTAVEVIEDGARLCFDLRRVYWCARLSGERQRLLRDEFRKGDFIADAFCGVGALCVLAATKLGCTVAANDINPDAVAYCKNSAQQNRVPSKKFTVSCGDAYDFLQNLGLAASQGRSLAFSTILESTNEKRDSPLVGNLPNHIIMNYPLDSPRFLGALRWWPSQERMKVVPRIHLYTFARGDVVAEDSSDANDTANHDNNKDEHDEIREEENVRDAMEVAVDLVGEGLIPKLGSAEETQNQRDFLNSLGCDVRAREVRDVAPGKVVICVSFSVTRDLLRVMQGEYTR